MVPPRLITIPISHYCEKARWALERAGIAYREEPHLQAIHWAHVWRAGRGRTAPVLVTADEVLTESAHIVRWAEPSLSADPAARALEAWLDAELGPHARRWMYHRILGRRDLVLRYGASGVPHWERAALPVFLPLVSRLIVRHLDVDDASAAESRERVRRVFDAVAERLADGRRFLLGDAFSAADLAFASLAAAVLLPPRYGVPLPPVEALPAPFAAEVRAMREQPAGRFGLRLYDQDRP